MISFELLRDEGILVVEPQGTLEASDFAALTREVDPYIEENGSLRGLLIQSESFPGWGDFGALISHLTFIRDHHRDIGRIAAVTDSAFLSIAPRVASHFVKAEVRHFDFDDRKTALAWLRGDQRAEEPFLDPASILKGKSSPRGEVLFRGEELIVEVYADDEVKIRASEPFPHDEFITILSGDLLLTDTDGVERKYAAGDSLMVPKGFTGFWHQSENFRELVVIEREAYDATYPPE